MEMPIITNKGLALLTKVSNNTLNLSYIALGSGENLIEESIESLKNEEIRTKVEYVQYKGTKMEVRATFSNEDIEKGFYVTEIGLYAIDPNEGEILYAYTCVKGADADYFTPKSNSLSVSEVIQIIIGYGNASKVNLIVDNKLVYMTAEDYGIISKRVEAVDSQLEQTANDIVTNYAKKSEVTNVMTPKGNIAYASLPTTGNAVGDYYYCADGDGTNPSGNYAWNGTIWYFAGTGEEGYSEIKETLDGLADFYSNKNLINPNKIKKGYTVNTILNVSTPTDIIESSNRFLTELFDIDKNIKYVLYATDVTYIRLAVYISGLFKGLVMPSDIGTLNDDGSYTIDFAKASSVGDQVYIITGSSLNISAFTFCISDDWDGAPIKWIDQTVCIREEVLPQKIVKLTEKIWDWKTVSCFGDSTTWGDNGLKNGTASNDISWVAHLSELCGFGTVINQGYNGSCVAENTSATSPSFVNRLSNLTESDLFIIQGGVNDHLFSTPLGELSAFGSTEFNTSTFYGAYEKVITYIKANFPESDILIHTPMKYIYGSKNTYWKNTQELQEIDYVKAIREIADKYGVIVNDLYINSGISPFVAEQKSMYMGDGLHYIDVGYKRLAVTRIAPFINHMIAPSV